MSSQRRKRKLSEISDGFTANEEKSDSCSSNFTAKEENEEKSDSFSSNFRSHMKWKGGKYAPIYLDILFEAVSGNWTYSTGNLYEDKFWNAFATELNTRITGDFLGDTQFTEFTNQSVIKYGDFLRAKYETLKDNPHELPNFDRYDRCFNKKSEACKNIPVFLYFKRKCGVKMILNGSPSASIRKRGSTATTSAIEALSDRIAYFVNNGNFDAEKMKKILDYFCNEESVSTKAWLKFSMEKQLIFLNGLFFQTP